MTKEEKKKISRLERALGYSFRKKELLVQALTHKSYAHERRLIANEKNPNNERLEFLGDAVLELVVSELLMRRYPEFAEGNLSKLRAAIVNEKQLASFSQSLDLGSYLYLGRGEEQTSGREKPSLLADAFEAILGAIYLDRGFKKAAEVLHHYYSKLLDDTPSDEFYQDYKTDLQEKVQSLFRTIPRYRLVGEKGPDHDKIFQIEICIREEVMGRGSGRSKKEAEQEAARQALQKLNAIHLQGVG